MKKSGKKKIVNPFNMLEQNVFPTIYSHCLCFCFLSLFLLVPPLPWSGISFFFFLSVFFYFFSFSFFLFFFFFFFFDSVIVSSLTNGLILQLIINPNICTMKIRFFFLSIQDRSLSESSWIEPASKLKKNKINT